MTLRVCCSPGVVCHVAVPTHERLTGFPEAARLVAHRHQQNRAKRGGECESRDWRTISRSYPKSCQPKLPFAGRAPHACYSMLVQCKRILILLPFTRSARELSGTAVCPPQCSAEPPSQPGAAERRQPRSSRPPAEPPLLAQVDSRAAELTGPPCSPACSIVAAALRGSGAAVRH